MEKRDHPTAEEVFMRAKHDLPEISLATVYNCLTALVKCGKMRSADGRAGPGETFDLLRRAYGLSLPQRDVEP